MYNEELKKLAELIKTKTRVENEIALIIERPALIQHVGEHIASKIFDITLNPSVATESIDGCFNKPPLAGRSVNIKWYGKLERSLDINLTNPPDYYLVMTGPESPATSSKGANRPWVISYVFLFDWNELTTTLQSRGVKIGVTTSLASYMWDNAKIYPIQRNNKLPLSKSQIELLSLFK